MDYCMFHWVWYLIGIIGFPELTIAIGLSLHGHNLHIPAWVMVIIWIYGIGRCIKKGEK